MGGTAPLTGKPLAHRAYLEKRAARKALCITDCAQGHQYLKDHQILGCNPQAGGVGNMWRHRHYSHRWGPTPEGDGSAHDGRQATQLISTDLPKVVVVYMDAHLKQSHYGWSDWNRAIECKNSGFPLDAWCPPSSEIGCFKVPETNTFVKQFIEPSEAGVTHLILTFWNSNGPGTYGTTVDYWAFGPDGPEGPKQRDPDIARCIRNKIREKTGKMAILCSAYGATAIPLVFLEGLDAAAAGKKAGEELGEFVTRYGFDGADIDHEESKYYKVPFSKFFESRASAFLCSMTKALRKYFDEIEDIIPPPCGSKKYIITHAPQAPYFNKDFLYSYRDIHSQVGDMIDFYNIQFYNQETTTYDTQYTLVTKSNGWATNTAVDELLKPAADFPGIPSSQIVIGKPIQDIDATNTGYIEYDKLGKIIKGNSSKIRGVMGWQWRSSALETSKTWSNTMSDALNN